MEEFLVLGIVPNTDIQISFVGWLLIVQTLLLAVLITKILMNKIAQLRTSYLDRRALHLLTVHHLL